MKNTDTYRPLLKFMGVLGMGAAFLLTLFDFMDSSKKKEDPK